MPEVIKKSYEEWSQAHWNNFCAKVELITDNEKVIELEKENERLQEKLELKEQESVELKVLKGVREDDRRLLDKTIDDKMKLIAEIQMLKDEIHYITSN